MNNLLEAAAINSFWRIMLHPLFELNKEIKCILLDRHRIRSAFKISISVVSSIILTYYALNNYTIVKTINLAQKLFNFSQLSEPLFSTVIIILLSSHFGIFTANFITSSFCWLYYGDPEFYLTPKRLQFLEEKFQNHNNPNITQKHIKEIVEFCIKNFHKEDSKELGGKKEDWRKTIESFIYEADTEPFLDQQKIFAIKRQQLEMQYNEIVSQNTKIKSNIRGINKFSNYGSIVDHSANSSATNQQNLELKVSEKIENPANLILSQQNFSNEVHNVTETIEAIEIKKQQQNIPYDPALTESCLMLLKNQLCNNQTTLPTSLTFSFSQKRRKSQETNTNEFSRNFSDVSNNQEHKLITPTNLKKQAIINTLN